jgi:protein involved in polysaccharide export with SLBB domain
MFKIHSKKNFKNTACVFFSFLLSACSVPGTYFSDSDVQNGYQLNGQHQNFQITELNSKWLSAHQADQPPAYYIGPYDILNIIVWNHPELTTPTTQLANPEESGLLVDEQGNIFFPFAGEVKVSGLTLNQAREVLEDKLKEYIRNPQLSVRVTSFRNQHVQVVGEVMKQGVVPITDRPMSVMQALNESDGINTVTANSKQIFVLYQKNGKIHIDWFDAQNPASVMAADRFYLQGNVIIYVPPAGVSAWNRVISQILPTVSGAGSAQGMAS